MKSGPATAYPRLLDQLTEPDRERLLARARTKLIPARSLIFSQTAPIDEVFIIEDGRVKAYYTTPEGQSITFAYWHAGMLMGVPGLSSDFNHLWTAEAVVETTLLQLPRADLVATIDGDGVSPRDLTLVSGTAPVQLTGAIGGVTRHALAHAEPAVLMAH